MPSSEVSVVLSASASSAGPPVAAGRSGASWRPSASASACDSASGTPMSASAVPSGGSRYTSPGVTRSPSVAGPGAAAPGASAADRSMTTTPSTPPASVPGSRAAPSSSTTCSGSEPGAERAPPGVNRGRSCSCSIGSSAPSDGAISRTAPAASRSVGCMLCGSHLIHSHCGIRSAAPHTLIRTSAGECITAT